MAGQTQGEDIGDGPPLARPAARDVRLLRLASVASVATAAFLTLAKGAVWQAGGSAAMLASMADSALDLLASLITFWGVRTALRPPDREHRFGHAKAEGLSALAQAAIMLGSASFVMLHAVERIVTPQTVTRAAEAYGVSVLAILLTVALVALHSHAIRRTGSLAIRADRLHYAGDLFLNLAAMAGVALATLTPFARADGLFGVVIAGIIGWNALHIGKSAIDMLMDRELTGADRDRIFNIALGNSLVLGLHALKTRNAGPHVFIQLHIEVDPAMTLRAAHLVSTEVEAALSEAFPAAEIIIHVDPLGSEGPDLTGRAIDAQ